MSALVGIEPRRRDSRDRKDSRETDPFSVSFATKRFVVYTAFNS